MRALRDDEKTDPAAPLPQPAPRLLLYVLATMLGAQALGHCTANHRHHESQAKLEAMTLQLERLTERCKP
jgi:hypothetical protein